MATKIIPWTNGTGSITLNYTGEGNGTIVVTSDDNNLNVARQQTITVKTTNNAVSQTITIRQAYSAAYADQYFTIVSLADNNTIAWRYSGYNISRTISVSTDGGITWTNKTSSSGGVTLATLNTGDTLLIKGSNTRYASSTSAYNYFTSTQNFDAYGNIMSLIGGDSFSSLTSLSQTYAFERLFYNCSRLKDASNLIMPATTLTNYCYREMFRGCSGLTTAPELPATTLVSNCYYQMFYGCSSLNSITCLATNISASNCTYQWVYNVASTGTFTKDASMSSWTTGTSGIPTNWTVENEGSIDISSATVTAANQTYTGSALTPSPTVTLNGQTIPSSGYTVAYSNNTNAGTATITVTGVGEYTGTAQGTFTIAKANRTISFTSVPTSLAVGDTSTLVAQVSAGSGDGTITFSSSDTSVATISGSTITGVADGSCTIYAMVSEGTNYNAATTSASISVGSSYELMYFTIESTSDDNTIIWVALNPGFTKQISYSTDNGTTWISATSSADGTMLSILNTGDKLLIKGNNASYEDMSLGFNFFASTGTCIMYGNIMSLVYGDNFIGTTSFIEGSSYVFAYIFTAIGSYLESAENLILPATTLVEGCYYYLFNGSSITVAPSLPATILADYCYYQMFYGCNSLNRITCLATDISAIDCTYWWTDFVAASGTFVKAAGMNDWTRDENGIPSGWTVVDDA